MRITAEDISTARHELQETIDTFNTRYASLLEEENIAPIAAQEGQISEANDVVTAYIKKYPDNYMELDSGDLGSETEWTGEENRLRDAALTLVSGPSQNPPPVPDTSPDANITLPEEAYNKLWASRALSQIRVADELLDATELYLSEDSKASETGVNYNPQNAGFAYNQALEMIELTQQLLDPVRQLSAPQTAFLSKVDE
jgi:hypothetical protein